MKIKIKVEKGFYKGSKIIELYIPKDVKWNCNNIVSNSGLNKGFCNYWTVINTNLAKEINKLNKYGSSIIEFGDKSIFIINNVKPFHSEYDLNLVSSEYFLQYFINSIIIIFDNNFNVSNILRVKSMQHPDYTTLKSVYLHNYYTGEKETILRIENKIDIFKVIYPYKSYSCVISGEKAEDIWKSAINYTLNNIDFQDVEIPYTWNISLNYEDLKDKFLKLVNNNNIEEIKTLQEEISKVEESVNSLLKQFGVTKKDLRQL